MTKSGVYCFKCKIPLDIIELDYQKVHDKGNDNEIYEMDYLDENDLSKGKCSKCGQIAYLTVEWMFTIHI